MTRASVLIVGDGQGPVRRALDFASSLIANGLIEPFWFADAADGGDLRVGYWITSQGAQEVPLFTSLGQREAVVIRVAGVATAGDGVGPSDVGLVAENITRELRSLAPSRSAVVAARIWFPGWGEIHEATGGFFRSDVNANLVVVPEDRRSDTRIAAPLGPEDGDAFARHVALELAIHLGLVRGMEAPLVEELQPGVIFGDKPKVRLARSYLRVARVPALPIQQIVDHEGRLPTPPGTIEAPSPKASISDLHERSEFLFDGLRYVFEQPEVDRRRLGPGETLALVLREMKDFLVALPRRAVEGMLEDLSELAGRTMQDLVGESSVVEVVWRGKRRSRNTPGDPDVESVVENLRSQALRRLALQGGPPVPQEIWRDIRQLVLGAADGGDLPHGVQPVEIHGRRAIVTDAASVAPQPKETLTETALAIEEDSESESPETLLGRLGATIDRIAESNRKAMRRLMDTLDAEIEKLDRYRPPGLSGWHMAGAIGLAALVISILLFSGAVRGLGIPGLTYGVRTIVYALATVGTVALLILFHNHARDSLDEPSAQRARRRAVRLELLKGSGVLTGGILGAAAGGFFVLFAVAQLGYPSTEPATYAAVLTGAVTGIGLGQAFSLGRFQHDVPTLGRMARLSVAAVLVYASILLMGAVAQPDGWYAKAEPSQIRSLLWPSIAFFGLILAVVLVYVSWRRVRERLRLNTAGAIIRQLAQQVDDALIGDQIAEAAKEQFLGLAAVLTRTLWYPYGRPRPADDQAAGVGDDLGLAKANAAEFVVSERGARLVERRTKAHVAERGWLSKQYRAAVDGFRQEEAIVVGASTPDAVTSPDMDPNTVAVYDLEVRPEKTARWRWADQLFAGRYDDVLARSLDVVGEDDPFKSVLDDASNFERVGADDTKQSLLEYLNEILPADLRIDARYFDSFYLAGSDIRRDWRSRLWWPDQLEAPRLSIEVAGSIPTAGSMARGRQWIAVRADTSDDLEPAALFGEVPETRTEVDVAGPDF